MYLLGIDLGTSGVKTAIFDTRGTLIASKTVEYPLYQPHNGWAEQNPDEWWNATAQSIRDCVDEAGIDAEEIVSLGLSGQMHGLVMLDVDNRVLRNAIIWCDGRTAAECALITELVGAERLFEITASPALTGFTASKIMWVKRNEPQIYEKCAHILLPKDFIRFKLTGCYATDVSDASGMQLLDIANRCWSDEILEKLDIKKELLPAIYESCEPTGNISATAAQETGLSTKTIVAAGASDNGSAAVGNGVVCDGRAFATIGTSGVVYTHTSKISIDPKGRIHTFCAPVPGQWHVMGVTQAAGLSLKWFRDTFCADECATAAQMGVDPYYLMDKEAEQSPIGANRLIYLPYLMGERTPHLDPNARGAFIGLSAIHTKSDCIRAVLEGVTYSLQDCHRIIRENGIVIERMTACGGGSSSPFWRQMIADVMNLRIDLLNSKEGAALGAAILGGVSAGVYADVKTACDTVLTVEKSAIPDEKCSAAYAEVYDIYTNLYGGIQSSCQKLAQLN